MLISCLTTKRSLLMKSFLGKKCIKLFGIKTLRGARWLLSKDFSAPPQNPSLPTQLLGGSQFPLRVRMALALLPGKPPPPASEGQKDISLPVCDIISLSFKKNK